MAGLYLHIPFCKQACHYCNFHFSTSTKYLDEMVEAICSEMKLRSDYLESEDLESIYFGGGTPSLLDRRHYEMLFETIDAIFQVNKGAEITLEANPDDLSESKLEVLAASPVNRLSIGVQSFVEEELQWMNRAHNAVEALRCISAAKGKGFENQSVDLIYGLPYSSHDRWLSNLEKVVTLQIPHLSLYALTVEEGTALGQWVAKGKELTAKDEMVVKQFEMAMDFLEAAGYIHYEISNYALPNRRALHNSNYWKSQKYLGVGPSAHSYNLISRSMNVANNVKYMQQIKRGIVPEETEWLDEDTRYNELVMTRLRTIWGIKPEDLGDHRFYFEDQVKSLLSREWVVFEDGIYRLSRRGKHFADAAAAELFV